MVHRPPGLFPGRAWLSAGTPIRLTPSMDQGHTHSPAQSDTTLYPQTLMTAIMAAFYK